MAQAILTQDVETLGEKGDVVDVSPGYLRNFLVPRKLAQPATAGSIAEAQRRKVQLEEPIRQTGSHMVKVEVHDGVTATVKTIVTAG